MITSAKKNGSQEDQFLTSRKQASKQVNFNESRDSF